MKNVSIHNTGCPKKAFCVKIGTLDSSMSRDRNDITKKIKINKVFKFTKKTLITINFKWFLSKCTLHKIKVLFSYNLDTISKDYLLDQ